ncbi:MAG: PKD domain-containing protein [Pirellulaceae bacterium]
MRPTDSTVLEYRWTLHDSTGADVTPAGNGDWKIRNDLIGDANLDGEFSSSDLVQIFVSALFETGEQAQWPEGDWNGDGRFDTSDFVAAFQEGRYEQGPVVPTLRYFASNQGVYRADLEIRGRRSDNSAFVYLDSTTVTVNSVGPNIELGLDFEIDEGELHDWPNLLDNLSSDVWQVEIDANADGKFETVFETSSTNRHLTYSWLTSTGGQKQEFRVRVTDLDENVFSEDSVMVTVRDAAPQQVQPFESEGCPQGHYCIVEGQSLGDLLAFRDGNDEWTVTVAYSDGVTENGVVVVDPKEPSVKRVQLARVFENEQRATATVRINDLADGEIKQYTIGITVANQAPSFGDGISASTSLILTNQTVFDQTLDINPFWTLDGQWQYGIPNGQGGTKKDEFGVRYGNADPSSGSTGNFVLGINLAGDYSTVPDGPSYLTTTPIDLVGVRNAELKFMRWLNIENQPWASASIEASGDNGATWDVIWENGSESITDNSWQNVSFDISAFVDGRREVLLRWGHEVVGGGYEYSGWNLDDIQIRGDVTQVDEATSIEFSVPVTDVLADSLVYEWDFNFDGATFNVDSHNANPTHQFPDEGTYVVAVRVSDGVATSEILTQGYVVQNIAPSIDSSGVQKNWNEGDTLSFDGALIASDAANDILSFAWELLDGNRNVVDTATSQVFNPANVPANEGEYTLRLTVHDGNEGQSSEEWAISIANVAPQFSISVSGTAEEGKEQRLSASNFVEPGR